MSQTKTIVSIGGKQYTLRGEESAEYIHRVALKVNSKVEEMKAKHPDIPNIDLAMLTAINLADDYIKLYDEFEAANKEIERLQKVQPIKQAVPAQAPAAAAAPAARKISPIKKK